MGCCGGVAGVASGVCAGVAGGVTEGWSTGMGVAAEGAWAGAGVGCGTSPIVFTGIGVGIEGRLLAGTGVGMGAVGVVCDCAWADVAAVRISSQASRIARSRNREKDMLPVYPEHTRIRSAQVVRWRIKNGNGRKFWRGTVRVQPGSFPCVRLAAGSGLSLSRWA